MHMKKPEKWLLQQETSDVATDNEPGSGTKRKLQPPQLFEDYESGSSAEEDITDDSPTLLSSSSTEFFQETLEMPSACVGISCML